MAHRKADEAEVLTRPEQLLVWRLYAEHSQTKAARLLGIPPRLYGTLERGDRLVPYRLRGRKVPVAAVRWLRDLKPHMQCLILRRRAGLSQAQVAAKVRCSRWLVVQMERGEADPARLMRHWKRTPPQR